ncbi:MAG: hypothetical protein QM500_09165 [Methylococcales bacterium]
MTSKAEIIDDDLPPEFVREINRRVKDHDNPVRYVIYSQIVPNGKHRFYFNITDNTFCETLETATLFKREYMAKAIVKAYSVENRDMLFIAKITTKNKKRKVLKYKF